MKKYMAILLILTSILGLTGCGFGTGENPGAVDIEDIGEEITKEETETADGEVIISDPEILAKFGTLIPEQTFETTLNDWGEVTFASFAPENTSFQADGLNPDVRFCLVDNGEVLYEFPGWNEEYTGADLFLNVAAVAFKDYNEDGLLDVITICEYETMSGSGYQTARVYFQMADRQGFEEDTSLTEYLRKNALAYSIGAIMDAREDYWDYAKSLNGQGGAYDQLLLMAENKDMWTSDLEFADEVYQYAVADLDRNGRYEVIVADMGGTGHYTYSRFFEINESYDGLVEAETDFVEGDSQPDIISETLETYMDDKGEFRYAVYDLVKNGAAEYYENVRALSLKDGKIVTTPIAYKTTIYSGETPTVTCRDADGNDISEEDYEKAAEKYFADDQKSITHLGWQDVRELNEDAAEAAAQLDASLNVYLYSE